MIIAMSFKFAWFVELLQDLDNARVTKALPASRTSNPDYQIVKQWFNRYHSKIPRQGRAAYSFLACMFPERLTQRSYGVKEGRLSFIFGRALGLGNTRAKRLNAWQETGNWDFATCVEVIMAECEFDPPLAEFEVTLEEIDSTLSQLAANSAFSSDQIRQNRDERSNDQLLAPILRRLSSREAKWLIRMILKSYSPIQIPEKTAMIQFHFLLPSILSIQDSLDAAVDFLAQPRIARLPHDPDADNAKIARKAILGSIAPQLGVMVKRPPYEKARSIKHCCQMADKRLMSVERKYDGEYCQVHIDLSKDAGSCVQIFSKSGKDSTTDRVRLHGAIKESLLLNRPGCKIKETCILEGELLVWNRTTATIEPFHKIRRHVMHGRRFLGTSADSPAAADEQLMIVFYDLLVLDDKVFANEPHSERRQTLKALITTVPSEAVVGERDLINFGSRRGAANLRAMFAKSITQGWEGFVLKGHSDPYFSFAGGQRTIKLKKDYITALGDSADLCIIGGRCDPKMADEFNLPEVSWTTFYLASLKNKADVVRFNATPTFKIVDTIDCHGISKPNLLDLNKLGQFVETPFAPNPEEFAVELSISGMGPTCLFRKPFVVEIMGAGFDKNAACDFYTLRFPRLTRIHVDRTLKGTMSFEELQEMAKTHTESPPSPDSQEDAKWIERLMKADGKNHYIVDKSQSTSPGRTPQSLASISLSPVSTRRPKPPVFVRIDTKEMWQTSDVRDDSQSTDPPSVLSSRSTSVPKSKRNASQLNSTPTPAFNAVNKRRRVESTQDSAEGLLTSQLSQALMTPSVRTLRPRRGPSAEAPKPAGPVEAAVQKSSGVREPLAEMRYASPETQRRSRALIDGSQSALKPSVSKASKAQVQAKRRTAAAKTSSVAERAPDVVKIDFPFLPTPPTSSAESAAANVPKLSNLQGNRLHNDEAEANAMTATEKESNKSVETGLLTSAVLISASLVSPDESAGDGISTHRHLQYSRLAFTYSSAWFVDGVFRESGQRHLVLVDETRPKTVANDILNLGRSLVNDPQAATLKERTVVVFIGCSFIKSGSSSEGGSVSTQHLEDSFCASLEMGPEVKDLTGNRAARVFWDMQSLKGG